MKKSNMQRFYLDDEFRKKLFDIVSKKGSSKELGKKLGYKGKHTARRFRELKNGVIKSVTSHQMETLSEITGIPLETIRNHAKSAASR